MARKRTKGIISNLGKVPKHAPKRRKKDATLPRKILRWSGNILLGAILVAVAVLLATRLFNPRAGQTTEERIFEVREIINDNPSLYNVEGGEVAAAMVIVRDKPVSVPLTPDLLELVESGSRVKVKYSYAPLLRGFVIDEWHLVGPDGEFVGGPEIEPEVLPGEFTAPTNP